MHSLNVPLAGIGPGSQPGEEDGAELAYLRMPSGMATYVPPPPPPPPPPESNDMAELVVGVERLGHLHRVLIGYRIGGSAAIIDLSELDRANRDLIDQTLGEGEVSILYTGPGSALIQETRLAGVWRVRMQDETGRLERDVLEVVDIPNLVRAAAFRGASGQADLGAEPADGVFNAPPILVEINDKVRGCRSADTRMECKICWHVYDPAAGDPVWQVPAGTPFAELPEHWRCPRCDGERDQFMASGD